MATSDTSLNLHCCQVLERDKKSLWNKAISIRPLCHQLFDSISLWNVLVLQHKMRGHHWFSLFPGAILFPSHSQSLRQQNFFATSGCVADPTEARRSSIASIAPGWITTASELCTGVGPVWSFTSAMFFWGQTGGVETEWYACLQDRKHPMVTTPIYYELCIFQAAVKLNWPIDVIPLSFLFPQLDRPSAFLFSNLLDMFAQRQPGRVLISRLY